MTSQNHYWLILTGKDRPGIIADITGLLFRHRCNLEDISMTLLEGQFAMMLVADTGSAAGHKFLLRELERFAKSSALVLHFEKLPHALKRGSAGRPNERRYIITALGRDRTGIVYRIAWVLARAGLNITDLNSKILGYGRKALYTMILEVDVPKSYAVKRLERTLAKLRKSLGIEIQIKPSETVQL
ncbi:MAG: ACT domain-containing protein [Candidatus Omnitrophota bacterium]|jgi:glycine cleavage system transcriptional repressor